MVNGCDILLSLGQTLIQGKAGREEAGEIKAINLSLGASSTKSNESYDNGSSTFPGVKSCSFCDGIGPFLQDIL